MNNFINCYYICEEISKARYIFKEIINKSNITKKIIFISTTIIFFSCIPFMLAAAVMDGEINTFFIWITSTSIYITSGKLLSCIRQKSLKNIFKEHYDSHKKEIQYE